MQNLEPIQLHLPTEAIAKLQAAISSGNFDTPSEAVYAALMQWDCSQPMEFINIDELRSLIQEGEDSGIAEPFTFEDILTEVRAPKL